tara:strand:+ start:45 stop:533 length:489 start_codon:yes stop_codon:yes gene_type:complete
MNWNQVLNEWSEGQYFTYPKSFKGKFQWNTSVIKKNGNTPFVEKFMTNKELPKSQDTSSYNEYITKSKNKYVVSFPNPSGDTMLIIPIPRVKKNFATIKDFMDNASEIHKREFWKEVSKIIREQMKDNKHLWVSAHGLGVSYFHIRICEIPKYYFSDKLAQK